MNWFPGNRVNMFNLFFREVRILMFVCFLRGTLNQVKILILYKNSFLMAVKIIITWYNLAQK